MPETTDTFPAQGAVAITPNDTANDTTQIFRALYVGGTGNIVLRASRWSPNVTFTNVPVGVLPVNCQWVFATGTTATGLVGLM